jgi:hypothetical protein
MPMVYAKILKKCQISKKNLPEPVQRSLKG